MISVSPPRYPNFYTTSTSWKEGECVNYYYLIIQSCCRFNPDRFAPTTSHAKRGLEFCPFGTPSDRKCPAYLLAHFETTIILAILLYKFQIFPVPNQVVRREHGLVTKPAEEVYIIVKKY